MFGTQGPFNIPSIDSSCHRTPPQNHIPNSQKQSTMAPRATLDTEELLSIPQIHREGQEYRDEYIGEGPGSSTAAASVMSSTPHREKARAEQRIGQYTIVKTLGEGSFGKVKLAVHRVTGQHVALKIIARKKLISRDMQGRVEREIEYLQLLRHPHIIKL